MHYYQHSIGDYRRDTMHLTLLEHGVYRQLLDLYYLNECELNANALRLICARDAEEIKAAETVLDEFFIKTDVGWKHKRCDVEIAKYHEKSNKAKASANARWGDKNNKQNTKAMRTHSEGNANQEPITINHKPIYNQKDFDQFWNAYPNKTGKQAVIKKWKIKKPDIDVVLKALSWQTKSKKWTDGFIPNPLTYVNQSLWEDEQVSITAQPKPVKVIEKPLPPVKPMDKEKHAKVFGQINGVLNNKINCMDGE